MNEKVMSGTKKGFLVKSLSVFLILAGVTLIFGAKSALAETKSINWVWSHGITIPGSEYEKVGYVDFPKRVLEATNGRLIIKPKIGIFDPTKNLFDARDGRCQGATVIHPYYSSTIPSFCWANVPGIIETGEDHRKAYAAVKNMFEKVVDEEAGVKLLFYGMFSEILIPTTKPIRQIDDFKGLKIRISNLTTAQLLEAMGASTTTIPLSEVYMAAQRGVIDGADASLTPMMMLKYYEVFKYAILLPLGHPAFTMVVNKKAFENLPKDIQQALVRVGQELEQEYWGRIAAESKVIYADLSELGLTITQMPADEMNKVFDFTIPIQKKWLELKGPEKEIRKKIIEASRKAVGR
jgi:TRAP-type C4-dicarboxylate transport system substrate-binding protein